MIGAHQLKWGRWSLDLSTRPHIMGVINITPDSFSDGGDFFNTTNAVLQGLQMEREGADILDVGGESTRPGAMEVGVEEELRRVLPVIEALVAKVSVPISIDTYKAEVARAAIDAGASIINDISAGRLDPGILDVAARRQVPLILMHMLGQPRNMQDNPSYIDVMAEITLFLVDAANRALAAGVPREMIVLDPGIGFGKTFNHNLVIINRLRELKRLGYPILVGASRKAFLGQILGGKPPKERNIATAAVTALAAYNGADILRVHDTSLIDQTLKTVTCVMREYV